MTTAVSPYLFWRHCVVLLHLFGHSFHTLKPNESSFFRHLFAFCFKVAQRYCLPPIVKGFSRSLHVHKYFVQIVGHKSRTFFLLPPPATFFVFPHFFPRFFLTRKNLEQNLLLVHNLGGRAVVGATVGDVVGVMVVGDTVVPSVFTTHNPLLGCATYPSSNGHTDAIGCAADATSYGCWPT